MNQQHSSFPPPQPGDRVTTRTAGGGSSATPTPHVAPASGGSKLGIIVAAVLALMIIVPAIGVGAWLAVRAVTPETTPSADVPTVTTQAPVTTTPGSGTPGSGTPDPTTPGSGTPGGTTPGGVTPGDPDATAAPTGTESTSPPWPTNPVRRYSFPVRSGIDIQSSPDITGTPDDLYVVEAGLATQSDASTVTRYIDGQPAWETVAGLASFPNISDIDGLLLLESEGLDYSDDTNLTRLNPDDGSVIWSITSPPSSRPRVIDGRLFVQVSGEFAGETDELVERDPATGDEINRMNGVNFYYAERGFVAVDPIALTAQLIDLNFEPVGPAVDIEASGVSFYPFVIDYTDDGWLYYADRRLFGGSSGVTALAPDGTPRFECPVTISEPHDVFMLDPTTVVAASYDAIEVTDIDGDDCQTRWIISVQDPKVVRSFGMYPYIGTYESVDDEINYEAGLVSIDVLDWQSGDVIAVGEGDVLFHSDGSMMTFEGDTLVASRLTSGEELWRIEGAGPGELWRLPGGVAIVSAGGDSATVDVYGD